MKRATQRPLYSFALAAVLLLGQASQAALLDTQNNPVSFSGGNDWVNPAIWDSMGIPKFPLDTPSDGTLNRDVSYLSIAHDANFYYVRVHCDQAPPFGGDYNLWLDIDHNPATGQRFWTGTGAIGAERLVTGAALIQNIPTWTIAWLNYDQTSWDTGDVPRDVFFSINRSTQMPGVSSFDFAFQFYSTPSSATGDWYPDAANTLSGDFFRYNAGTEGTVSFSGRTWTTMVQQTPLPSMGGQYDPIQTNSYTTPDANTGLITGRFGIDSSMTTPVSLHVGDTVEYDFLITTETRNLTGNNPDTWFGSTGTGFQNAAGEWVTDRNMRFNDSRNEDYFTSPSGNTDKYVNRSRSATQSTHVKWVLDSLTTATVTLTLSGDATPYATFTNTFSNIGDIAKFRVGLYDSEQDVIVSNFTITASTNPPPAVLVFCGRPWTPLVTGANRYAALNPNAVLMTGNFAIDCALTTPVSLAVGDKVSYDYSLSEISRNSSTWVGDSRTGFQDSGGNWASGRIATYNSRWEQYFEGINTGYVYHARGNPWTMHVEWVFTSTTSATVTLTLAGETVPFVTWTDSFTNIENIAKFRVGLWDSQQDVTLANFTIIHQTGSIRTEHFWHVGEDNQVLPTDSVSAKPFTGGFGTRSVDTTSFAPGSAASLNFANGDGGDYMNSAADGIFVPQENWVLEMWVNPANSDFGHGVSLVTLGNDTSAAQIGMVGGNWFFGEMNVSYGNNSSPAAAGIWTHLAWVRDNGTNRFFVGGTEIGSDTASLTNNGRLHLFIKPGGGEVPAGNVDEIRFSTFNPGSFNPADLLAQPVLVVTNHSAIVRSDHPVSFWRLDESAGANAVDIVAGHDGAYTGTLTYGVAGALPGDPDTAIEFDGSSGYAAVPYVAALNPQGPFSVEAWVRPNTIPNSAGTPCPLSSAQFSGDRSGWQIRERDTGWQFVLYSHSGSGVANNGLANTAVGGTPSTNSWTHLVAVYDGANSYLYVNGVAYSSSASGYVANYDDGVNAPGPFTIGARSSLNNNFAGRVDEVAFYSRALSETEVLSHYADRPVLKLDRSGTNVILTWPVGTLQEATEANGTYTSLPSATAPYTVPANAPRKFYRLKL